jgi:allantoin racemase
MKILIINPNTTVSMTTKVVNVAKTVARPTTEIIGETSKNGPSSIQGYLDAATCVPGLLDAVQRHPEADGIVIACFDDTGLDAVRSLVTVPVIGIGEAAFHAASLLSNKFSVITTLSRSVPGLENNLIKYGLAAKCVGVRATDIPVLKLEEQDPGSMRIIRDQIEQALTIDHAEAIVLGCAGMANLMRELSAEFSCPVIDGVVTAVGFVEALVSCNLKTSKRGAYLVTDTSH